jgi:hypothetical protein
MQFNNQKTRNVADAVAKILAGESAKQEPKMLEEELKGNQHKIDANKNNKVDAHDFKLLRAKKEVKKEEVEQEEEKSMTFSEMLAAYKEHGLAVIAEEPTEEEFNKEIKKAQAKSEGKEKADVAKASVQAVKQEEIEVLDANVINGVEQIDIEERTLTKPEASKKEEIVKSMKKKMSGFKERYGERAKNVMYATATKMAKKD